MIDVNCDAQTKRTQHKTRAFVQLRLACDDRANRVAKPNQTSALKQCYRNASDGACDENSAECTVHTAETAETPSLLPSRPFGRGSSTDCINDQISQGASSISKDKPTRFLRILGSLEQCVDLATRALLDTRQDVEFRYLRVFEAGKPT